MKKINLLRVTLRVWLLNEGMSLFSTQLPCVSLKINAGEGIMYCGAVEFVCAPAAVKHVPVLLGECMSYLSPEGGGDFADLTFGGGGHSRPDFGC